MGNRDKESLQTRASLLGRLSDLGDSVSWREFFDTYWGLIYGVARKAGLSDADAQDVVQDTMSAMALQMPTFRHDPAKGSFKAWLLNLTRWRIVDHLRKRRNAQIARDPDTTSGTDALAKLPDPASLLPDTLWEAEWKTNLVKAALVNLRRRVDPEKFQIFDFYVNKGWTPQKVAVHFQVSIDAVYLAKHRVTELLKAEVHRLEQHTT